ncbi:MAG TPA: hypothetical protein VN259_04555 [Xanthomonadales bacterium]|nr:hypothetical protein [Xanthomonadales bacterium]
MGMLKSVGAGLAYPFTRAYHDVSGSVRNIGQSYRDMQQARRDRHEQYERARAELGDLDERQKFARLYEMNGWDEAALREQASAARRTRLLLLCAAGVGMVIVIALLWVVRWWVMMILGPLGVVYLASCAALAVKFAWFEHQIETRRIMPIKVFLARPDLFARVIG